MERVPPSEMLHRKSKRSVVRCAGQEHQLQHCAAGVFASSKCVFKLKSHLGEPRRALGVTTCVLSKSSMMITVYFHII